MKSLLTFLIVLSTLIYPQVTEEWVRTYNGYVSATALASAVDQYGNVYITGEGGSSIPLSGSDYYTIKYNSEGVLQWEATYDGEIFDNDWGYCIDVDPLGNVYVTGESKGIINGWDSGSDILTIKYDSQGNELWTQRFHGNTSFTTYNYDKPWAITVDDSGNVYLTGTSVPTGAANGFGNCITIKYSTTGNLLWAARYGNTGHGEDIKVDNFGNVYVFGEASDDGVISDLVTIKYNSSGQQLWVKKLNSSPAIPAAMELDEAGNVYVTASAASSSGEGYHTIKYNSTGDSLWGAVYVNPYGLSYPSDLALDQFGSVYVTGRAGNLSDTGTDYLTIKYDASGQELWIVRYEGLAVDYPNNFSESISLDFEGNVYITGTSTGENVAQGDGSDFATVKYNNAGIEQWVERYHRTPNETEQAIKIHSANNGKLYVVGWGIGNNPNEIITIKYSQSPSDVQETNSELPSSYSLQQNYPNPFNPSTKIRYSIPSVIASGAKQSQLVTLKVYDVLGNEVATLVNEEKPAGIYEVEFNSHSDGTLSSGVYFYKLQAGSFVETKKMVLIK